MPPWCISLPGAEGHFPYPGNCLSPSLSLCPRQYSGLEKSMDCVVHGVATNQIMTERLSLSL